MTSLDSANPQGTEGTPSPTASSESGQPSSETVNLTKAEFDKLQKRLERLENDDRSAKDRAVTKTNKRIEDLETKVNPLLERAAEFIKGGDTPKDALQKAQNEQDDLEEKQLLREFLQGVKSGKLPAVETSGNVETKGVQVADVINEYQLDGNDPEVIAEVISKNFANETEAKLAAANIALRRLNPNSPSPAASTTLTGSTPQKTDLSSQYNKRLEEMRKSGRPNASQIADLKAEFRKKGLEVW